MTEPRPSVIYAGGGTGGHVFPAVAIAERIRDRVGAGAWQWLVCSERSVDAAAARPAVDAGTLDGLIPLEAKPFGVHPLTLARFIRSWPAAVRAATRQIESSPTPPVVVATGGFVAAPVVAAARRRGRPVVLVGLDAALGKASRWIAGRADVVFDAAPRPAERVGANWQRVGPVVRRDAMPAADRGAAISRLGLDPDRRTLLVTGGSQGSRSITAFVRTMLVHEPGAFSGWQAVHQCADADRADLEAAYSSAAVPAMVSAFLPSMSDVLAAADLHVGRAGAGTVSEMLCAGVPSVFFPYPYHRDGHQRLNAEVLVASGQALVCDDLVDAERNREQHGPRFAGLLRDAARVAAMRRGGVGTGVDLSDGAAAIADRVLEIARTR